MHQAINNVDSTIETGENVTDSASKKRKINYIPLACFLCGVTDNPKRMTSLAGPSKSRFREVTSHLVEIGEHQQNTDKPDINASKICIQCSDKVRKELSACFVCGEIVNDPRMKRSIANGRFTMLAMEERVCFQGVDAKREVEVSDQTCFCCQKRINGIIQEEESGNATKMKIVLQRSKTACIVCQESKDLQDFPRSGRIDMFIKTGKFFVPILTRCRINLFLSYSILSSQQECSVDKDQKYARLTLSEKISFRHYAMD